jgi:hypothetical protein
MKKPNAKVLYVVLIGNYSVLNKYVGIRYNHSGGLLIYTIFLKHQKL